MDHYTDTAIKELNDIMKHADFMRIVSIDCFCIIVEHQKCFSTIRHCGRVEWSDK